MGSRFRAIIFALMVLFAFSPVGLRHSCAGEGAAEPGRRYDLSVFVGKKHLDEDEWEPVDEQSEFGVHFVYTGPRWPVSFAATVLYASDDGTSNGVKREVEIYEIGIGVR